MGRAFLVCACFFILLCWGIWRTETSVEETSVQATVTKKEHVEEHVERKNIYNAALHFNTTREVLVEEAFYITVSYGDLEPTTFNDKDFYHSCEVGSQVEVILEKQTEKRILNDKVVSETTSLKLK